MPPRSRSPAPPSATRASSAIGTRASPLAPRAPRRRWREPAPVSLSLTTFAAHMPVNVGERRQAAPPDARKHSAKAVREAYGRRIDRLAGRPRGDGALEPRAVDHEVDPLGEERDPVRDLRGLAERVR